jgi:FtsP/CotA-like multicopper oxidase with cupredoxin domain
MSDPHAAVFPTDPTGLPPCARSEVVALDDGDTYDLRIARLHGLRLDNRFDGVAPETQRPIPVGGTFEYRLHARRFLVVARDETPEPNLVWKDTVLVRAGETVDVVLEVTGEGRWMAHCHIAEHNQDGMMLAFDTTR